VVGGAESEDELENSSVLEHRDSNSRDKLDDTSDIGETRTLDFKPINPFSIESLLYNST
jgi:hypothetical protein